MRLLAIARKSFTKNSCPSQTGQYSLLNWDYLPVWECNFCVEVHDNASWYTVVVKSNFLLVWFTVSRKPIISVFMFWKNTWLVTRWRKVSKLAATYIFFPKIYTCRKMYLSVANFSLMSSTHHVVVGFPLSLELLCVGYVQTSLFIL